MAPEYLTPSTANDQRLAFAFEQRQRITEHRFSRRTTLDAVHAFLQEVIRVVVGLGLHVLRQGQGHRAGFGGVGEHTHGVDRRGHELLWTIDAVPVFAHGLERVVGADAQVVELLDLLQHRVRLAAGVNVAGQQQQRNAVGGRRRGGGQHVRRARPYR